MDRIKIVIVGNGAVGKTCIIHTYTYGDFPAEYVPNVYSNWCPRIEINGKFYSLSLWDTAGQQDYDRLRPLSYPETNVFLICFSVNDKDSFENITNKWIPEISHHCPHAPFFIIRTKDDLIEDHHQNDLLVHGYLRKQLLIPMDIFDIIERYFWQKYDIISDKDAQELCDKVGGYKYMTCSSLQKRGLNEMFEQVGLCYIDQKYKTKGKNNSKRCITL